MSQEPNVNVNYGVSHTEIPLPVPRRMPSRPAESINPNFERYNNVGPDSGFALKIVNKYKELWSFHPRKKLITNIIVNLILFRSSQFGRAPTNADFHLILGLLRISEKNIGELTNEVLETSSKEAMQGAHITKKFNFLT